MEMPNQVGVLPRFLTVERFFSDADSLRAQFAWRIAITRMRGAAVLVEAAETDLYRFLGGAADRVFTQEMVTTFLSALRAWAQTAIGVSHASSPQVQVFSRGCWLIPNRDAKPTKWQYLYQMNRPSTGGAGTRVTLVPLEDADRNSLFQVGRAVGLEVKFNTLLVFEAAFGYGVDRVHNGTEDPISSAAFLVGSLW